MERDSSWLDFYWACIMRRHTGFTIVELLIVIVVIAVLAAITVVAFNSVQQRARESVIKTDLSNAMKQMELAYAQAGAYPTALPSGFKPSNDVVLSLSQASTGYCINAELTSNSAMRWYFDKDGGGLQQGSCSGAVISGSEFGTNPSLITNNALPGGWTLSMATIAGRTQTTRAGTAGDPYPSRPVLVINNGASTSTAWATLTTGTIDHAAVIAGRSYTRSYYVRKVGTYSASLGAPGLLNADGLNQSLSYNVGAIGVTDGWQKVNATSVASQNAPTTNRLYISLPIGQFTTSGWSLEFQAFELREA